MTDHFPIASILALSIIIQFAAAIMAFWLIGLTGRRLAWSLVSAALMLMAVRRLMPLYRLILGDLSLPPDPLNEIIGLVLSAMMAVGIMRIAPLFIERKLSEEALRKSEKKIRDITSSLGEGLYVLDVNGAVTFMNPEAERLLGWTKTAFLSRNIHDVIHNRRPDGTPLSFEECKVHNVIKSGARFFSHEEVFIRRDGTMFPVSVISAPLMEDGKIVASVTAFGDISEMKRIEQEREKLIAELQKLLAEIKTLRGILPICSSCEKIRDDKGAWTQMKVYISEHSDVEFSHGLCSECMKKLYPEYYDRIYPNGRQDNNSE